MESLVELNDDGMVCSTEVREVFHLETGAAEEAS